MRNLIELAGAMERRIRRAKGKEFLIHTVQKYLGMVGDGKHWTSEKKH